MNTPPLVAVALVPPLELELVVTAVEAASPEKRETRPVVSACADVDAAVTSGVTSTVTALVETAETATSTPVTIFNQVRKLSVGEVEFDMQPPDAVLELDGKPLGQTRFLPLLPRTYVVTARRVGYEPLRLELGIAAGQVSKQLAAVPRRLGLDQARDVGLGLDQRDRRHRRQAHLGAVEQLGE